MKFIRNILFAIMLIGMASCDPNLLELENENEYGANYFQDAPQFDEALVAAYAVFNHQGMYSRDWYFMFDLLGNDAERNAPLEAALIEFSNYTYGGGNKYVGVLWHSLYRMKLRANLVIGLTNQWEPESENDKKLKERYIGEARFLRGLANFYLVNLWGRVPLKLHFDFDGTDYLSPRKPIEDVWDAIEKDFKSAAEALPLPEEYDASEIGRATKGAAIAMLGKAYLFRKDYSNASKEFKKLTEAPFSYSLNPDWDNQFSENNSNSTESVFQVMHQKWTDWGIGNQYYMFGGQEGWGMRASHTGRAQEYGFNEWINVKMSNTAVDAFTYPDEDGNSYTDPRASLTFYGDESKGGDTDYCNNCPDGPIPYNFDQFGYTWRKYQHYEDIDKLPGPISGINSQVIRYSDVLLMLAEAYTEQNQLDLALPLINQVRERVNAFEYSSLGSQENAREILRRERQLEFCGEQVRWFDLVRWETARETLNAERGFNNFQNKHSLFPIPIQEKASNPEVANDIEGNWN